ncbi:hypothetical protein, partial [Bradyrhizobium sp.]|uniref:hypothetical protein n=1 Tax=Bradyrhizobium sp. TaxID=376 RepID=UPI0025BBB438
LRWFESWKTQTYRKGSLTAPPWNLQFRCENERSCAIQAHLLGGMDYFIQRPGASQRPDGVNPGMFSRPRRSILLP